jgi:hypothetical protein
MAKAKKGKPKAVRKRAYAKSLKAVNKARKNLDLKLKKHHLVVSSMFYPTDPGPGSGS